MNKLLPMAVILWNAFDAFIHISRDMAEPLRIAANIIVMVVAVAIIRGSIPKSPIILFFTALLVIAFNAVHEIINGIGGIPMHVFVGGTILVLFLWSKKLER